MGEPGKVYLGPRRVLELIRHAIVNDNASAAVPVIDDVLAQMPDETEFSAPQAPEPDPGWPKDGEASFKGPDGVWRCSPLPSAGVSSCRPGGPCMYPECQDPSLRAPEPETERVSGEREKALAAIAKAQDMVEALCRPRGTEGAREWWMSIPARDDDPDLVIADALDRAARLLRTPSPRTPSPPVLHEERESFDNAAHTVAGLCLQWVVGSRRAQEVVPGDLLAAIRAYHRAADEPTDSAVPAPTEGPRHSYPGNPADPQESPAGDEP